MKEGFKNFAKWATRTTALAVDIATAPVVYTYRMAKAVFNHYRDGNRESAYLTLGVAAVLSLSGPLTAGVVKLCGASNKTTAIVGAVYACISAFACNGYDASDESNRVRAPLYNWVSEHQELKPATPLIDDRVKRLAWRNRCG
jgi:hypothetical protein